MEVISLLFPVSPRRRPDTDRDRVDVRRGGGAAGAEAPRGLPRRDGPPGTGAALDQHFRT